MFSLTWWGKTPNVLFLMETKQTVDEMRKTQADLKYDSMLAVPCVHRAGGLAMLLEERGITGYSNLLLKSH